MTGDGVDRPTRRDAVGWLATAIATAASGVALGSRALQSPGRPPDRVPGETVRIGRRWRGTGGTLRVHGTRHGTDDIPDDSGIDTNWLRVDVSPASGSGSPVSLWIREGTCVEVEARSGSFVAVEGALGERGEFLLGWHKRVRLQVPTAGTGPPVANPDPRSGPSSIRNRDGDPRGGENRYRSADGPAAGIGERLHVGRFVAELGREFGGRVPVVAGPGVFDAEFGHSHGFPPFPVDEDATCKRGPDDRPD